MDCLDRAATYLNSVTVAINSLAKMAMSNEIRNGSTVKYKIVVTLIELEQATAEFIEDTGLDSELPQVVSISKSKFIGINERLIKHLEKLQLQSFNLEQLISNLKLENTTLKEEVENS